MQTARVHLHDVLYDQHVAVICIHILHPPAPSSTTIQTIMKLPIPYQAQTKAATHAAFIGTVSKHPNHPHRLRGLPPPRVPCPRVRRPHDAHHRRAVSHRAREDGEAVEGRARRHHACSVSWAATAM